MLQRTSRRAIVGALCLTGGALALMPGAASAADFNARQSAIANAITALWQAPAQSFAVKGDTFTTKDVILDDDGSAHVRLLREHDGLPVIAGDLIVHLRPGGALKSISAAQTAPITDSSAPQQTAAAARTAVQSRFGSSTRRAADATLVYDATKGAPRLAHQVVVKSTTEGVPSRLQVLVDADSGETLRKWDDVNEAIGTGHTQYSGTRSLYTTAISGGYTMFTNIYAPAKICALPGTLAGNCSDINDADNVWGNGTQSDPNTKAADASFGVSSTFDFLDSWFGRSGVYSDGTQLTIAVNPGPVNNAFNLGKQPDDDGVIRQAVILLGNGPAGANRPFTPVDIVAHEVAHSVTEDTAGLPDAGEPGGIGEASSDIIGTLTEFYTDTTSDPANYTLGEDLADGPWRYMYQPSLDADPETGTSPDCWSSSVASMDTHKSSGLGNKFFFMLAEGSSGSGYGTAPTCGAPAVTGIGQWSAARIWYRALTVEMNSTTVYKATGANDARATTLKAATDLFGYCSKEYRAVQAAWTATNVAGEDVTCPVSINDPVVTGSTANLTTDTTLGATVDWIHWQNSTSGSFDRKNATQKISTWSLVGASGNTGSETTSPTTFSWTDAIGGTLSGSATTGTSRKLTDGRGLKFTIPFAANESRKVRVLVGVRGTTTVGKLSAYFGTGTPVTSTVSGNSTTAIKNYTFTLNAKPTTAQTLNVEFTQVAGGAATGSAVVLYGAALH